MILITPTQAPHVDRDTDFSITFTANPSALVSQINSVRAYPAGMGGTNSSNYPSWDTGVIFTSGTNSVTISGQHNSAFGGDEIIHIPKGASTRMTTIYSPFVILEKTKVITIEENARKGDTLYNAGVKGDGNPETKITYTLSSNSDSGVEVDPDNGRVYLKYAPDFDVKSQYSFTVIATEIRPNGERPMSSSEFVKAKEEFPDLVAPTVTAGVANVPPNQEIVSFKADSTNFVDRNITIEVGYESAGGSDSTFTTTVTLRVKNDLNKFLTWIKNYLNTYSPVDE